MVSSELIDPKESWLNGSGLSVWGDSSLIHVASGSVSSAQSAAPSSSFPALDSTGSQLEPPLWKRVEGALFGPLRQQSG